MIEDLSAAEVHLWCAFPRAIHDARLSSAYRLLLSDAERAQEERFYFERDRRRYLVTRTLVRTVLSRYSSLAPQEWAFTTNRNGRPEIANPATGDSDLRFNVTHTDGLIIVGVARGCALGVDAENISSRRVPVELAEAYFAPDEAAALRSLPADRQPLRFLEYWTLKEAYVKARGLGLSIRLDQFSFRFPDEKSIRLDVRMANDAEARWYFWQLRPVAGEHVAALCVERTGANVPALICRVAVPLVSETNLQYELTRVSEPHHFEQAACVLAS